jgi:PAS domain-containing protein
LPCFASGCPRCSQAPAAISDSEKGEILKRWLSVRYKYGINTKEVLSWIGALIAVFSLVIGLTVIWNRRLSREVLQRTRAEQSLRENEAFIHAVMENLPVGIAVNSVDPTVRFAYMNENFAKYYRTETNRGSQYQTRIRWFFPVFCHLATEGYRHRRVRTI